MREPVRSDFAFVLPISVKWGEMDALGHVNNTVFFRYAEDGRIDYFHRLTGTDQGAWRVGPILAQLNCGFRRQLRYPGEVVIGTRVSRIGGSSLSLEQALFDANDESLYAVFETIVVWFDFDAQQSVTIDADARERIVNAEIVGPEL